MPLESLSDVRLIGAPFTPFDESGAVNLKAVTQQAAHMRKSGLAGAFIAGTTGESPSLSVAERMSLAHAWREVAGDLQLIVHVGGTNIRESMELAAHAASIGADAIAAVPPFYFRPAGTDALVEAMSFVAGAAPELPYYYYHIPALTKVELPMVPVMKAAIEQIPNFAGIKFTDSNLMEYSDLVELGGDKYEVMFGRDPLLMFAMAAGARAAVGSTYMFAADLYRGVIEAVREGRFSDARERSSSARELVALANRYGGLPAQKAIYNMVAVDAGAARPPFQRLAPSATEELRAFARKHGFFDDARAYSDS